VTGKKGERGEHETGIDLQKRDSSVFWRKDEKRKIVGSVGSISEKRRGRSWICCPNRSPSPFLNYLGGSSGMKDANFCSIVFTSRIFVFLFFFCLFFCFLFLVEAGSATWAAVAKNLGLMIRDHVHSSFNIFVNMDQMNWNS
jgi:hypothetical protein